MKRIPNGEEHIVISEYPLGIIVHIRERYAYIDTNKKEFDFTREIDLTNRESDIFERNQKEYELRDRVRDFWEHLPRKNQGNLNAYGFIAFEDMLITHVTQRI